MAPFFADSLKKRLAMLNDDVVKCPLCGGFSHIEQPNLLAALRDPPPARAGREVHYGLLKSPVEGLSGVASRPGTISRKTFIAGIRACPCGGAVRRSKRF